MDPNDPARPAPLPPRTPRQWPRRLRRGGSLGLVAVATLAIVAAGAWWLAPRVSRMRPLPSLEDSRRRIAATQLARYAARVEHGDFLPPAALTIALHERFLQRSFAASLPFERAFDDGKIVARLDSIAVDVADGATIVTLRGRARLADNPAVFADLLVQGTFGVEGLDFDRGRMLPRVEFTDVRVLEAGPSGLRAWTNPVASYFTHRSAADFNQFQPVLPLPLQFSTRIELPAVAGDVVLPAVAFPVHLRLQAVTALEQRLALSIELRPDTTRAALVGPPAAPWDGPPRLPRVSARDRVVGVFTGRGTRAAPPPPGMPEIARLRSRVHALAGADSLWAVIRGTEHDLVVVLPEPLLAGIVRATTGGYRSGVAVSLEPELTERLEETIRTRVLGRSVTAGKVTATIQVRRVEGRLVATGEPHVRLEPPNGLVVEMPLRLEGGEGAATADIAWDPSAMGWIVCKGFAARRDLTGRLGRIEHRVSGTLRFAVEDGRIVGRSELRRDRVQLPLDLTPASWDRVRDIFVGQDRLLRCGMVMDPDRMVALLRGLGQKGVRVRLPGGLPGFTLPLTFGTSVIDSAYRVGAEVRGIELTMTRAALCVRLDGLVAVRALEEPRIAPPAGGVRPAARRPRRATPRGGRRRCRRPPRPRGG